MKIITTKLSKKISLDIQTADKMRNKNDQVKYLN